MINDRSYASSVRAAAGSAEPWNSSYRDLDSAALSRAVQKIECPCGIMRNDKVPRPRDRKYDKSYYSVIEMLPIRGLYLVCSGFAAGRDVKNAILSTHGVRAITEIRNSRLAIRFIDILSCESEPHIMTYAIVRVAGAHLQRVMTVCVS